MNARGSGGEALPPTADTAHRLAVDCANTMMCKPAPLSRVVMRPAFAQGGVVMGQPAMGQPIGATEQGERRGPAAGRWPAAWCPCAACQQQQQQQQQWQQQQPAPAQRAPVALLYTSVRAWVRARLSLRGALHSDEVNLANLSTAKRPYCTASRAGGSLLAPV